MATEEEEERKSLTVEMQWHRGAPPIHTFTANYLRNLATHHLCGYILAVLTGWLSIKSKDLNKIIKVALATPPLALSLYVGFYFTIRAIG